MYEFKYKNNELWCEDVRLQDVASEYGTPLYVYNKQSVIDHCRHIENAFEGVDHLSCFAVKANANVEILKIIADEGIGSDVGSAGELYLSLKAGFPPSKITFSGVGKRADEIEYALDTDILSFNGESVKEIDLIQRIASTKQKIARILLRVNFDIEAGTHRYITTGRKHNKFGIDKSKAKEILLNAAKLSHIEVLGIHTHIGSQITDKETFISAAKSVVSMVDELRSVGIPVHHVNFGGGFGVQYQDFISHPQLPVENADSTEFTTVELIEAALPILKQTGCKILIQPGRSIIAHPGILITKVLYRKVTDEKIFIITDAGMNDLLRPSLYKSYHQIIPLNFESVQIEIVDVVGPLCETGDFFAIDRNLPFVKSDDYLAIMCAGAYGYVLSSNYNGRPRPAEMLVDGYETSLIRKREKIEML
ncbi:MAG: diaminopimelate decarboxylase [Bacteroidota bacterium]